jgi:hypothetical protein
MACGRMSATKVKKSHPETSECGQFIRSTMLDMDSRLRVARAIEKDETQASRGVFELLKRRGHPDGRGGIDEPMIEVYGRVPEYRGRGRPPRRKKPGADWLYPQMVKHRDGRGHFAGTTLKVIFGSPSEVVNLLGKSTAYIERSHLTSRLFNGRQARKALAFSKDIDYYWAAATWEDSYYNLARLHKSLRMRVQDVPERKWYPRTLAMAAHLTDHVWTVKELLTTVPLQG